MNHFNQLRHSPLPVRVRISIQLRVHRLEVDNEITEFTFVPEGDGNVDGPHIIAKFHGLEAIMRIFPPTMENLESKELVLVKIYSRDEEVP